MKKLALIGSTGSIGRQVCEVVRRNKDRFQIQSLVAHSSVEAFLAQVHEFMPAYAVLVDEEAGKQIAHRIPDGVQFACGKQAALDAKAAATFAASK